MREKIIKVYEFEELKPEIQEKVLNKFREDNEYIGLNDILNDRLNELIKENKLKIYMPLKILYSLSSCQGDGLMFEGVLIFKNKYYVTIQHKGNYYHKYSSKIYITNQEGIEANDKIYSEFKRIYHSICDKLEKEGYSQIGYEDSDENIKIMIDANQFTFRENGDIENI